MLSRTRPLTALGLMTALLAACSSSPSPGEDPGSVRVMLRKAHSCAELEQMLKDDALFKMNAWIDRQIDSTKNGYGYGYGPARDQGVLAPTGAPVPGTTTNGGATTAPSADAQGSSKASSFSQTNTQVEGVDEADIVKTDGNYLYVLHGSSLEVVDAWPVSSLGLAGTIGIEGDPIEMFVDGQRAVVYSRVNGASVYQAAGLTARPSYQESYAYGGGGFATGGVDIAGPAPSNSGATTPAPDSSAPAPYVPLTKITVLSMSGAQATVVAQHYFEGDYVTSRRVASRVRTVLTGGAHGPAVKQYLEYSYDPNTGTSYPATQADTIAAYQKLRQDNTTAIRASKVEDWLPYVVTRDNTGVHGGPVACEELYVPTTGSTAYGLTSVESINLDAPGQVKGASIVGQADTVYANENSMYLAARAWIEPPVVIVPATTNGSAGSTGSATGSGSTTTSPPAPAAGTDPGSADPPPPIATPPSSGPGSKPLATEPSLVPTFVSVARTHLHRFDLTTDEPLYVASGSVEGSVKNQFSLDEKDGILRLSTTDQLQSTNSYDSKEVNHLFTMQMVGDELRKLGSAGDLAPGEHIESTRFVGDIGYLVTFRQLDPLFVVDLSHPAQPTVLGALEIPGFSEYMHPLDAGHLLTIGTDTVPGHDNGVRGNGVLLQIFDVTDPLHPTQTARFAYGDPSGTSEAQTDHKAFTYFAEKGILAFPYVSYEVGTGQSAMQSTLELFRIDAGAGASGIQRLGSVDHGKIFNIPQQGWCGGQFGVNVRRGVFLENYVYSISYGGVVVSDTNNMSTVGSLGLPAPASASDVASPCYAGPVGGVAPLPD